MLVDFKGVLLKIVGIALLVSAGFIAYNTIQNKNESIQRLQETVSSQTKNIKALEEDILKAREYKQEQTKLEEAKQEAEIKVDANQSEAKKYVEKKISEIESKYKDMPDTEESQRAKEVEYSLERVRGLWVTFCIQVPSDSACKQ